MTQDLVAQLRPAEPFKPPKADEVVLLRTGVSRRMDFLAGVIVLTAVCIGALVIAKIFFW